LIFHKSQQSEEAANVIYHPEDLKGPVLFSFRAKSFFGKKKASIKVEDGEWSDKFSLDVAGSSGVVSCTSGDTIYQVLSLCKCCSSGNFVFGWNCLLVQYVHIVDYLIPEGSSCKITSKNG
jgi:hypothetical protein